MRRGIVHISFLLERLMENMNVIVFSSFTEPHPFPLLLPHVSGIEELITKCITCLAPSR